MPRARKPNQFTLSDDSNKKLDEIVTICGKSNLAFKNRSRVVDQLIKEKYDSLFKEINKLIG